MLVQWRFKVMCEFATCESEIYTGHYKEFLAMKPRPERLFLYRPSSKRYDYVDYTGKTKGVKVDLCDNTPMLEFLGYIKFVDSKECNERNFT